MMGMLKTIGIEKGKPYEPDDKTKAIYRKAVVDAYHYMQETFAQELPGEAWWDDRKWRNIFFSDANKSFKWETDRSGRLRHARGASLVLGHLFPGQGRRQAGDHVYRHDARCER